MANEPPKQAPVIINAPIAEFLSRGSSADWANFISAGTAPTANIPIRTIQKTIPINVFIVLVSTFAGEGLFANAVIFEISAKVRNIEILIIDFLKFFIFIIIFSLKYVFVLYVAQLL